MPYDYDPATAQAASHAVPDFDGAPGTHGELLRLREREREELCDFAQQLLSRLDAAA